MNKPQQGVIHESDLWQQYENALQSHDWYFYMSDDHMVYTAGRAEKSRILQMKERLSVIDKGRAEALYNKYLKSL